MSPLREYQQYLEVARKMFAILASPIPRSNAISNRINQVFSSKDPDSFHIIFNLKNYEIERYKDNNILGYSNMTIEKWIREVIHPSYWRIYIEFGTVAYQIAMNLGNRLEAMNFSHQIQIPVKLANKNSFVWVSQVTEPCDFDINGQMVSHITSYRRITNFYSKEEIPFRPMIFFDNSRSIDKESELKRNVQESLFHLLFKEFSLRHKKLVLSYWKYISHLGTPLPDAKEIISFAHMKLSIRTVQTYNSQIISRMDFIDFPFNVGEARELGLCLFKLLGKCELSILN